MDQVPLNVYVTRVRAHQTDLNGAMHHGAYLDIFDDARIETFRRLGYDYARTVRAGFSPVISRLEARYHAPAFMDELLRVKVLVPAISRVTMTIRYECRREDQLLAVGEVVFAFVGKQGRPIRIPSDLREIVEENGPIFGFSSR